MKINIRSKIPGTTIAIVIIIILGINILFQVLEHNSQSSSPINQPETLKDAYGTEFTPDEIVVRFNTFMKEAGAEPLSISELVPESEKTENIYREVKDDISISIYTSKESPKVTFIHVLSKSSNEKPTAFLTYCSALMDIFTPVMKSDVRQKVLYSMTGYNENEDTPLHEENTYIILHTKYTYTYSEQKGLSMWIEQMPPLEEYSGDLPTMIR